MLLKIFNHVLSNKICLYTLMRKIWTHRLVGILNGVKKYVKNCRLMNSLLPSYLHDEHHIMEVPLKKFQKNCWLVNGWRTMNLMLTTVFHASFNAFFNFWNYNITNPVHLHGPVSRQDMFARVSLGFPELEP